MIEPEWNVPENETDAVMLGLKDSVLITTTESDKDDAKD